MMGFGIFGALLGIIFWVFIIWLFFSLVFRMGRYGCCMRGMHHGYYDDNAKDPQDIVKERYAKGEIDEKKFQELMKNLS